MFSKLTVGLCLSLLTMAPVSANPQTDHQVLHGKVQGGQIVRIQRPATPTLNMTATQKAEPTSIKALIDFGDGDFAKNMQLKEQSAWEDATTTSGTPNTSPLQTKVDSAEMLIAWEAWHKRVCSVIYENWLRNSRILGVAHTTIRVTKDHRISVEVHDIEIAPTQVDMMPRGYGLAQTDLTQEFQREVEASVQPLNGSNILAFPDKSLRTETEFSPYFKKAGESGYDWKKDDYERVPIN